MTEAAAKVFQQLSAKVSMVYTLDVECPHCHVTSNFSTEWGYLLKGLVPTPK
jgi:hypothetical protein